MIGEFCPKVFALNSGPVFRSKTGRHGAWVTRGRHPSSRTRKHWLLFTAIADDVRLAKNL